MNAARFSETILSRKRPQLKWRALDRLERGLVLGGAVPGLMVCIGLMIYSYFFGAPGIEKQRATLFEFGIALREAVLPLLIPVIIIGSILGGVITPAEAGMAAV